MHRSFHAFTHGTTSPQNGLETTDDKIKILRSNNTFDMKNLLSSVRSSTRSKMPLEKPTVTERAAVKDKPRLRAKLLTPTNESYSMLNDFIQMRSSCKK